MSKAYCAASQEKESHEMTLEQTPPRCQPVEKPGPNDVLSGRGNFVNYHSGNKNFRLLVKEQQMAYVAAPKHEKPKFARKIVNAIKNMEPPGRFLRQDKETGMWIDVGEKKSLDKTRQALRENAPTLLKTITPTATPTPMRSKDDDGCVFVDGTEDIMNDPEAQDILETLVTIRLSKEKNEPPHLKDKEEPVAAFSSVLPVTAFSGDVPPLPDNNKRFHAPNELLSKDTKQKLEVHFSDIPEPVSGAVVPSQQHAIEGDLQFGNVAKDTGYFNEDEAMEIYETLTSNKGSNGIPRQVSVEKNPEEKEQPTKTCLDEHDNSDDEIDPRFSHSTISTKGSLFMNSEEKTKKHSLGLSDLSTRFKGSSRSLWSTSLRSMMDSNSIRTFPMDYLDDDHHGKHDETSDHHDVLIANRAKKKSQTIFEDKELTSSMNIHVENDDENDHPDYNSLRSMECSWADDLDSKKDSQMPLSKDFKTERSSSTTRGSGRSMQSSITSGGSSNDRPSIKLTFDEARAKVSSGDFGASISMTGFNDDDTHITDLSKDFLSLCAFKDDKNNKP